MEDLTQKEVSDIIEKTATKLPAYQYSNVTGRPNSATLTCCKRQSRCRNFYMFFSIFNFVILSLLC